MPGRPHTDRSIPDPRISRGHYLRVRISGGYGEVVNRGSNGAVVSVPRLILQRTGPDIFVGG
jgi:hypothetical protein